MVRLKRALSSTAGVAALNNSWPSTNGLSNFQIDDNVKEKKSIAERCSSIEKAPVPHQKCKVIATIGGEKSKSVEDLCSFLEAGVTVARYDFSHSTSSHEEFQEVMENLTKAQKITVRLLFDIYSRVRRRDRSRFFFFDCLTIITLTPSFFFTHYH
jgi:hypothetical protein